MCVLAPSKEVLGRPQKGILQGAKMAYPFLFFFFSVYLFVLLKLPVPKVLKIKVQLGQDQSEVGRKAKEQRRPREGWGRGCLGAGRAGRPGTVALLLDFIPSPTG